MLSRPGAVQIGWALQIGLVLSGFVVPTMFFLGVVFAALWWASVHFGRKVDEAKARFARRPPGLRRRLTLRDGPTITRPAL